MQDFKGFNPALKDYYRRSKRMPATSKVQRRFMAMCEHGKATRGKCPEMSKEQMHDFAATKEKGLPMRKGKESRVKKAFKRGMRKS